MLGEHDVRAVMIEVEDVGEIAPTCDGCGLASLDGRCDGCAAGADDFIEALYAVLAPTVEAALGGPATWDLAGELAVAALRVADRRA